MDDRTDVDDRLRRRRRLLRIGVVPLVLAVLFAIKVAVMLGGTPYEV